LSAKTPKLRKNRYKKKTAHNRRRIIQHLAISVKLVGLIAVLLAASALFMAGYAAVTQSDYFRTESIQVHGNQRLSAQTVINQMMVAPGDNMLAVNLHLVRKRLLAHPWIASASVIREIPGCLQVYIEEQQALAVLDLGRKFLINAHGRIFKEYGAVDPEGLPVVKGIAYADISLGEDQLGPAMQAVLNLLKISRDKSRALPFAAIAEVLFDPELGIALTTRRGEQTIKLGRDQLEEKYGRLDLLLSYLQKNSQWGGCQMIDLNNPDRIVVKFDRTQVSTKAS
jgi:cell division protein FtsQ